MKRNEDITQEELKDHLTYNPEKGFFVRNFTYKRHRKGDIAGTEGERYIFIKIEGVRYRVHRLASFDSQEAAFKAYPQAKPSSEWLEPQVSLSHLPSEDDPVAGGMYPDDIS